MEKKKSCGILLIQPGFPHQFLLMKHPHRWDLPKGHLKVGETEHDCAFREVEEETGITREQIKLDPTFRFELVYYPKYRRLGGSTLEKTLVIFLGWLSRPAQVRPQEHQDFAWIKWEPPHNIQIRTIDPLLRYIAPHLETGEEGRYPHTS